MPQAHRQARVPPRPGMYRGRRSGSTTGRRALTRALLLASVFVLPSRAVAQDRRGPAPAASRAAALVLDGVTVVDVEHGRRLHEQRVVVVGNRIRALGNRRAVAVPRGARVVNAGGKYLIPGLWDMHTHTSTWRTIGVVTRGKEDALYRNTKAAYHQLIANGVTGIRDASSWISLDTFRVWKREIAAGRRVGPRLIVSGKAIDDSLSERCRQPPDSLNPANGFHTCVTGPDAARRLVDSLQAAGADMIKTYTLSSATYFAIAAEARRVGIPFGGHVNSDHQADTLDGLIASDSGARILDHDIYASACRMDTTLSLSRCAAAAARLRRQNTWIASAFGLSVDQAGGDSSRQAFLRRAFSYGGPDLLLGEAGAAAWQPLTAAERRRLPSGADFAALVGDSVAQTQDCRVALLSYAANLPVVPGLDWPASPRLGVAVHSLMLGAVLCGVPPLWALQLATLNPARALHATDSLGTVAVGKVADLVLLEGDPLEDIWNVSKIAGVVADGHYFDRRALDELLRTATAEWRPILAIHRAVQEGRSR